MVVWQLRFVDHLRLCEGDDAPLTPGDALRGIGMSFFGNRSM